MLIFWGVDPNILISGVLSVLSSEIFLRNLRRTWLILSHPPEMKSNKLPSTPQKHRQTYNFYRKNFRHDLVKRWTRIFWPYKQTPDYEFSCGWIIFHQLGRPCEIPIPFVSPKGKNRTWFSKNYVTSCLSIYKTTHHQRHHDSPICNLDRWAPTCNPPKNP